MNYKKYLIILFLVSSIFSLVAVGYDLYLRTFDIKIINFFQSIENSKLTFFYKSITDVADTLQSFIITAVLVAILYFKKHKKEALFLTFTMATCGIVMAYIKNIFMRQRPDFHRLIEISGLSFPSGHSTSATVLYLTLALILINRYRKANKYIFIAFAFIGVLVITTSRIYLGVHYPTDTIAGVCLGIFIVTSYYMIYYKKRV